MIDVRADIKRALTFAGGVPTKLVPKLTSMALNKAARKVSTVSKREVALRLGVKSSAVKRRFFIQFARPKKFQMMAAVRVTKDRPFNLAAFTGARQTSKGVSIRINGGMTYSRTFFIKGRGSVVLVMRRARKGGRRVHRKPLTKVSGPPLKYGFMNRSVQVTMATVGRKSFTDEFTRLAKLSGSFRG